MEKYALISVYDKAGIIVLAKRLRQLGWRIYASGGTAKTLAEGGVAATDIASLVGGRAILGHRVVTLSRELHAGLLADKLKPEDIKELADLNLPLLDMLVCDFYPLKDAIEAPDATIESVVKETDIGGPCMVRSGAKGLRIVVCRHDDREPVLLELESTGDVSLETRQKLRSRAEFEVAKYAAASARFHSAGAFQSLFGERVLGGLKGENGPQSPAALFTTCTEDPLALAKFTLVSGSAPSYNNFCDLDRALHTVSRIADAFKPKDSLPYPHIVVGVKHGNACGASVGTHADLTIKRAVTGDKRAIFGGTIMCNFPLNGELASCMVSLGLEGGPAQKFDCVVAPGFDGNAAEVLNRKGGKCRMMANHALAMPDMIDDSPIIRPVRGGFLMQPGYKFILDLNHPEIKVFGPRRPELESSLKLAGAICVTSNSNTITIAANDMLIGNGVGQQDRIGAAELAVKRAIDAGHKDKLNGASAWSDSFFPFIDAPEVLIRAGIKAIFSTSGSVNDASVQELCLKNDVTLYQLPDMMARGFFRH